VPSLIETIDAVTAAAYDNFDPLPAWAALEEFLTLPSRSTAKAKSRWDLTTEEGFAQAVIEVALSMRSAEAKELRAFDARFRRALDKNWPGLSAAERREAMADVRNLTRTLGGKITGAEAAVLKSWEDPLLQAGKVSAIDRYGLGVAPTFTRADTVASAGLRQNMVHFIRDREGRIAEGFSEQARGIVARGLEDGLGRDDISLALRATFGDMRKPSYWDFCSNHFVARERAVSALTSYQTAKIVKYMIVAMLDEKTTDTCRFLDGKIFDVQQSIEMLGKAQAESAEDPNLIKEFNPFINTYQTERGPELRMMQPGGGSVRVASIERSGVGRVDAKGTYTNAMKDGDLQKQGVGPPPYHQFCRTNIVPETEERVEPVTVAPPVTAPIAAPAKVPRRPKDFEGLAAFAESMEFRPGWMDAASKVKGAPRGALQKAAAMQEGFRARGEKVIGDLTVRWKELAASGMEPAARRAAEREVMSEMASRFQATSRRVTGRTAAQHEGFRETFLRRMDDKLFQGNLLDSTTRPSVADRAALGRIYNAWGPLADKVEGHLQRVEKIAARAHYKHANGYIRYFGTNALTHEFGHGAETLASTRSGATLPEKDGFWTRFRDSRKAKGERIRSLGRDTGVNYDAHEKYVRDKFEGLDPYTSKVYSKNGNSEFVSMLSERLLQDPAALAAGYDWDLAKIIDLQPDILSSFFGWAESAVLGAW